MAEKGTVTIFLSLGSNLGGRESYLDRAKSLLPPEVKVIDASSIYETEPWGYEDQPPFLNQVLKAKTTLPPPALLSFLKKVEADIGREETFRYGPRKIDIDILFYGDRMVSNGNLEIPHPRILERAFVLVPLAEIAPDLEHPGRGETIQELLVNIDQSGVERYSS